MESENTVVEVPTKKEKKQQKKAEKKLQTQLSGTSLKNLRSELSKISGAFKSILSEGVKPEFVVALIHDVSRIKKKDVRKVLETASNLEKLFLLPANNKVVARKKTSKKSVKRKTK